MDLNRDRRSENIIIITARIRSMTGRYCFHRCLSVNISGGGYPVSGPGGEGYPISGSSRGGTRSQVQVGGYPISGLGGRGVPHLMRWGVPHLRSGGGTMASTCYGYMAGGMPLAFTQEDFLVNDCSFYS